MELRIISEDNMPNTVLCYIKNFLSKKEINMIHNIIDVPISNDKTFIDSGYRSQKWFQKNGKYFCEKWKTRYPKWMSFNYNKKISSIENIIMNRLKKYNLKQSGISIPTINSLLINKYNDGNDYIRPHRDTNLTFGKFPTIINISIGDTRELLFKKNNSKKIYSYNLESGSCFIMSGSSQELYTHEITKSTSKNIRYSLTLRKVI
tara:strand:- start:5917 stop:6531 length:615 start_codon:yes stop_codon:yes gene_type:complete